MRAREPCTTALSVQREVAEKTAFCPRGYRGCFGFCSNRNWIGGGGCEAGETSSNDRN